MATSTVHFFGQEDFIVANRKLVLESPRASCQPERVKELLRWKTSKSWGRSTWAASTIWPRKQNGDLLLYDSKDLVTHAVCVGMTGSGKTGLCIGLLEEAAIDGIPAIVIDPKGDLADLLLTFPDLSPRTSGPGSTRTRPPSKGLSPEDFAEQQAELWKQGLADWGQDGARIARLKAAADFAIYTPGTNAGLPVSILKSFAAPAPAVLRRRRGAARPHRAPPSPACWACSASRPTPSRAGSTSCFRSLFDHGLAAGQRPRPGRPDPADPEAAVRQGGRAGPGVVLPGQGPLRAGHALNNLLAAPGFETWLEGEPLDIGQHAVHGRGQGRGSRSSPSPTWPTPSACSSSRCC